MQKNVLVVFPSKKLINLLAPRTNFSRSLKQENLALIWKRQNLCAKEQPGNFFRVKSFLSLYFEQETFKLWAKLLREKSHFLIFRVQRAFRHLFLRDTRFFRKVSLKLQASEEKFKQCFQKCLQDVEKNVRVLFGNSSFFFSAFEHFFSKIGQKTSGSFFNTVKYVCRTSFW